MVANVENKTDGGKIIMNENDFQTISSFHENDEAYEETVFLEAVSSS